MESGEAGKDHGESRSTRISQQAEERRTWVKRGGIEKGTRLRQ